MLAAIASWEQVRSIHAYFKTADKELESRPQEERERLREKLSVARALVGEADALEKLRQWKTPDERWR